MRVNKVCLNPCLGSNPSHSPGYGGLRLGVLSLEWYKQGHLHFLGPPILTLAHLENLGNQQRKAPEDKQTSHTHTKYTFAIVLAACCLRTANFTLDCNRQRPSLKRSAQVIETQGCHRDQCLQQARRRNQLMVIPVHPVLCPLFQVIFL